MTVFLNPQHAKPFYARHPWVFAGAIGRVTGEPADGAEVDVRTHDGLFVARGLFNSNSKIRVRLYTWDESEPLDRDFFARKLDTAIALRHDVLHLNTGPDAAYRVVFSEADGLSGLTADRYADYLSVQFTSLALAQRREMIAELLREKLGVRGITLRTEKGIGKLEGVELHDGPLLGDPPPAELVIEARHGLKFAVDLAAGQKTGFYLDQRDNRSAVLALAPGRRVLDAFSYTGGFGIHAAKGGATDVVCVDASESALAIAGRNAVLNGLGQLKFVHADAFGHLSDLADAGETFDLIVLDPPKFARNRAAVPRAVQGYRKLHRSAMRLLGRDGVLVSCCCTGLISAEVLDDVIAQTAADANRAVQILDRRGPSADHPTAVSCRETGYLKCVISRVV